MAKQTKNDQTSRLVGKESSSSSFNYKVYPSEMVAQILVQLSKRFPIPIEIQLFLTGNNDDEINQVVVPEHIVGILNRANPQYLSKNFSDFFKFSEITQIMLGVIKEKKVIGLQISSSSEQYFHHNCQFIPFSDLCLDKPLISYLSNSTVRQLFPGKAISQIKNEELFDRILNSRDLNKYSQRYLNGGTNYIECLLDCTLRVDVFSSPEFVFTMNEYVINTLLSSNNQFMNGKLCGMSHIHYKLTDEQLKRDPYLNESYKVDEHFFEFISPNDAYLILISNDYYRVISKGLLDTHLCFMGVSVLDPISRELVGSTYFDALELLENDADFEDFKRLTLMSINLSDYSILKDYYQLIRKYSSTSFPKYVKI